MELFKANRQWSTRQPDERFDSLAVLDAACAGYRSDARTTTVPYRALAAVESGDDVAIVSQAGTQARMTHWAFGQLCARVQAPAGYLRELPVSLAAANLNHGISRLVNGGEPNAKMLFHTNGSLLCRAFTSERYTRIWNSDVTSRLLELGGPWRPAPAARDGSRGLYASDHDMFVFLVDNNTRVFEEDHGGLARGFFVWNSEVGAASFGIMTFLYRYVCGNHVVWGASGVRELRIRHIGHADGRAFAELRGALREYDEASESHERASILGAKSFSLGKDKDAVLDAVFRLRVPALSRSAIAKGFNAVLPDEDGDPRSAWGLAQGLTRVSQREPFADARVALDRAAGKVLEMSF